MLYSRGAFVVFVFLLLFGLRATWGIYEKEREARANADEARATLTELKNREQFLRAELERLSTQRGVEQEIRKRFPVVKGGEEVAVVVDKPGSNATATPETPELSWWGRLWHALTGR